MSQPNLYESFLDAYSVRINETLETIATGISAVDLDEGVAEILRGLGVVERYFMKDEPGWVKNEKFAPFYEEFKTTQLCRDIMQRVNSQV